MAGAVTMGPVQAGTLVTGDLSALEQAYRDWLEMTVVDRGELSSDLAVGWGMRELAGSPCSVLASASGVTWLRAIEQSGCEAAQPLAWHGWLSLEVLVADVDALAARLENSPFRLIGPPANLDVSDAIRACQVVGPAGEVLYLTSVGAQVPPFDLPEAICPVDRLFIPVLAAPDRDTAMHFYRELSGSEPLAFETRITVINRALGLPVTQRHPVATVQLAGKSLIEIDQLAGLVERPEMQSGLVPGIAMVSFEVDGLDAIAAQPVAKPYCLDDAFYRGRRAALYRGAAGEWVELIERSSGCY